MEKRVVNIAVLGVVLVLLLYFAFFMWAGRPMDFREGVTLGPPDNSAGTCSVSDYGIYPSTKGSIESSNYNYGETLNIAESCLDGDSVIDYGCASNHTYVYRSYGCKDACNDGACTTVRESYLLRADKFIRDPVLGINYTTISENTGTGWTELCQDVRTNDICNVGSIALRIDEVYISSNNETKWVEMSFGGTGTPFQVIHDSFGNKLQFLPVQSDLPTDIYVFNILDKDGGWYEGSVQDVTAYWDVFDDELKINYTDMLPGKSHGFSFEIIDERYVEVSVDLADKVVSFPVLFADVGTGQFISIGDTSGESNLATSSDNSLTFNPGEMNEMFWVSLSNGGFINGDGQGTPICEANIIANVSECSVGDARYIYYLADNGCADVLPENSTYDRCDYDMNGIIGLEEDIDVDFDLDIYENGNLFNISKNFSGTKDFEFDEGSDLRVVFEFDFDESALDFTNIYLRKQDSDDSEGYLIVNGLEDVEKTFYIDKLSDISDSVCVKKSEITSIGSISDDCDRSNEVLVMCDGRNYSGFSCTAQGGDYKVTGLFDSAVLEFKSSPLGNNTSSCSPIWVCGDWSVCASGVRTRVCTDTNDCGTLSGKPHESEVCTSNGGTQNSCSDLGGEVCNTDEICDISPVTSSDGSCCLGNCEAPSSGTYFWVIFSILVLAIIVVIVMIVLSLRNKSNGKSVEISG